MREADIYGFDPFREEYPEHPIQTVGQLVPKDLLRDWEPGDPPRPEPKQLKCGQCFNYFMAKAAWFCGKWDFAAVCSNCGDGNTLPPGFLAESKRPPIRQVFCSNCGIGRGVEATLCRNLWQYELTCAHCGQTSKIFRRIRRACSECGEDFFVDDLHPKKICHECAQKGSSKSPY